MCVFVFQAEDGIRDLVRSRGLGDVYKRQVITKGSFVLHGVAGGQKMFLQLLLQPETGVITAYCDVHASKIAATAMIEHSTC